MHFFISCKAADCKVAIFSFYIHFKGYITLPILQLVTLAMFFMLNWYFFLFSVLVWNLLLLWLWSVDMGTCILFQHRDSVLLMLCMYVYYLVNVECIIFFYYLVCYIQKSHAKINVPVSWNNCNTLAIKHVQTFLECSIGIVFSNVWCTEVPVEVSSKW